MIVLKLSPQHLDIVMRSLAEQPYKTVAPTINEIMKQAQQTGNTGSDVMVEAQANGDG